MIRYLLSIVYYYINCKSAISLFFFFNDTATTEIYTLSLHDALPISPGEHSDVLFLLKRGTVNIVQQVPGGKRLITRVDRKSTRLNSSHDQISYAVFCLKKKKKITRHITSYHADYDNQSPRTCTICA